MRDWLPIDTRDIKTDERRSVGAVQFNVFVAPDDVPERVRGYFDPHVGRFVIEFGFLGLAREPMSKDERDAHVRLVIGRNSRRLYRIEVDVASLKAERVALTVMSPAAMPNQELRQRVEDGVRQAINRLATTTPLPPKALHYKVAEQVIARNRDDLLRKDELLSSP